MNTQTHVLLAAALLARKGENQSLRNSAIVLGALIPDAVIFALFFWSKMAGIPEQTVWDQLYYNPPWSEWIDAANSVPLYVTIAVLGWLIFRTAKNNSQEFWGGIAIAFGAAGLLHLAADLPLHVNDAHAHFMPFTQWKFISQISYWDPDHYGLIWLPIEALLGIICAVLLWRRFPVKWLHALCIIAIVSYIAVPAYFILALS